MRPHLGALVALALLAPAAAQADPKPVNFPDWVAARSAEAESYPSDWKKTLSAPPSATAVVRCHRQNNGDLDHCNVVSETPKDLGFGDAAAVRAVMSTAVSPPADAMMPGGDVLIPVAFDGQAEAATLHKPSYAGRIVTNPDWVRKPDGDDLMRYYPEAAMRLNLSGKTSIACYVTVSGSLDPCQVVSETPEGVGFGAAALGASRLFVMRPKAVDGEPVAGGVVVIPINFIMPDAKVTAVPVWSQTPTPAQIAAAFPKEAAGVAVGRVVLHCRVAWDGSLKDCREVSEDPKGRGFAAAAKSVALDFRLNTDAYGHELADTKEVTLPITFYAPAAEKVDPVTNPVWTRMIDARTMQSLFPAKAAEAGLKAGRSTVDCVIDHAGRLTQCQPITEEPAGMDFGAAVARVASVLAINPWTSEGRPVDGAHIHLPIVLTLSPEGAKP